MVEHQSAESERSVHCISLFQTNDQSGTFKCARSRCKTCPFIHGVEEISGPKRSTQITDHFTCTPANVIYGVTCTYCDKLYIGETGRRLGDRFRERLRYVERIDKNASKPVARNFNPPNYSKQHVAVCGLSLNLGSSESRKTPEQKFIFQIGTINPHGINERFSFNFLIYFNLFLFSRHHIPTNSAAPFSAHKSTHNPWFLQSLWSWRRANLNYLLFLVWARKCNLPVALNTDTRCVVFRLFNLFQSLNGDL